MKEEIQIDPKIDDQGLMFHFAPAIGNLDVSIDSNSYRFIHCMLDKMTRGYDDKNPEKIGFIGRRDIIEYSLISMLDFYEKYIDNVLMSDLFPYTRHANSQDLVQHRDPLNINEV
jgi:hypothetical protein